MKRREFLTLLDRATVASPLAYHSDVRGRFKMKLRRRRFLYLVAGAAALPAVSRIARAQTYPSRPVRILVG